MSLPLIIRSFPTSDKLGIFLTSYLFQFIQLFLSITMQPTIVRLIQIIPRKALQLTGKKITPPPVPQTRDLETPTLLSVLMQQREASGELWPRNIRIEPVVKKEAFKRVHSDVRIRFKNLLKER